MESDYSQSVLSLNVHELNCSRYDATLFSDLNFNVSGGQILQIAGVNGSGKTTLLKVLCGLVLPDEGEVLWCGENIQNIREEYQGGLNYIGHNNGIKLALTCIENLKASTAYASRVISSDFSRILEQFGLEGHENTFAYSLSAGQKRRLSLTRLAVCDSRLWILDEPFTSLDETSREYMKKTFYGHLQSGGMILMTSHDVIQWKDITPIKIQL